MLQMERLLKIRNLLHKNGVVRSGELAALFSVSQNTIRRDLQTLATEGFIRLSHGGAVLDRHPQLGQTYDERQDGNLEAKLAIGQAAVGLLQEGDAIILDAGTTTAQIAKALRRARDARELTVITNALGVAVELVGLPGVNLVLTGGVLNEVTQCVAGFHAEQFLSQFHVHKAFISAGGVTADGVTNTNTLEVQIKRHMIAVADRAILVVTADKIGRTALAPFARITEFSLLLTNRDAPQEEVARIREQGLEVMLC